jgi:hypothetical protein
MAFSFARMQQRFEAQFEPGDQGGYLYRANSKAAAIPVSSEERDTFAMQYAVRLYAIVSAMVLAVTVLLGVVVLRTDTHRMGDAPTVQIFAGMVVISLVATAGMEWVFRAPARALKGRAPVSRALTSDEAREVAFKRMTYGRLAAIALLGLSAPIARRNLFPENVAWHRWSWAIAVVVVLVATTVAVRKWRFESAHSDDAQA